MTRAPRHALAKSKNTRRRWALLVSPLVLLGIVLLLVGEGGIGTTPTTTTSTTTTTVPLAAPQAGWTVASASRRGVMVDYIDENVGGTVFRVLRLRARTTLLRWHAGYLDPPGAIAVLPVDARSSIDWSSEGLAGVVAVFNGGFKKPAGAGGAVADGVVLEPLVRGDMTVAINAQGHWSMGVWGAKGFPAANFHAISYRQNLGPMILHGALTAATQPADYERWGSVFPSGSLTSRSGLGVDARGNLLYAAAIGKVDVAQLATALLHAGAITAMQLDINPFWPILGASRAPLHAQGVMPVQLNYSQHNPSVFEVGWERDFFVAMAEPGPWVCAWSSPGVRTAVTGAQPQPLSLTGKGCRTKLRQLAQKQHAAASGS
jgi:hypothetical protein